MQDEEAKRKRIEELREKRRQERLMKIQKENERLKQIENHKKANAFYRHMLLSRLGMNGFKILIKIKKRNERKAEIFHRQVIVRSSFHLWKLHVYNVWNYRKNKADNHYNYQLVKKCITALKKVSLRQKNFRIFMHAGSYANISLEILFLVPTPSAQQNVSGYRLVRYEINRATVPCLDRTYENAKNPRRNKIETSRSTLQLVYIQS